jgi:hypothetical protein
MANILFLNPNDIPRITALNGNIDVDKLTPYAYQAQRMDIKRILRETLYNKILADYQANTLTGVYLTIYNDYIVFIMAYYTASYYIALGSYQIVNNGIVKMDVEGGKAVEMKDANFLADKYKQLAINFETELINLLEEGGVAEYPIQEKNNPNQIIPWY